jgi:hypothetical protein
MDPRDASYILSLGYMIAYGGGITGIVVTLMLWRKTWHKHRGGFTRQSQHDKRKHGKSG